MLPKQLPKQFHKIATSYITDIENDLQIHLTILDISYIMFNLYLDMIIICAYHIIEAEPKYISNVKYLYINEHFMATIIGLWM